MSTKIKQEKPSQIVIFDKYNNTYEINIPANADVSIDVKDVIDVDKITEFSTIDLLNSCANTGITGRIATITIALNKT